MIFGEHRNITIAEIQNNIFTIQECSIHERGNRNEIVNKFELMKLSIIISHFMELSKVILENFQYLQLHSPFQLIVLDGRIVNIQLHTKIYNNNSNSLLQLSDIAN